MPLVVPMFVAALIYAIGGVCMKASDGLTKLGPTVGLYVCFIVAATVQAIAMKRGELGSVYMFVVATEGVLAYLAGLAFFGESLTPGRGLALVLIVAGLALLR